MSEVGAVSAEPLFTISVAAQLAGMHPQTLRQYDRLGLVSPSRAKGKGRRYSMSDIDRLREVQRLSQDEGVNLAGIRQVLRLEEELAVLRRQIANLERRKSAPGQIKRVFTADSSGHIRARSEHFLAAWPSKQCYWPRARNLRQISSQVVSTHSRELTL